MPSVLRTRLIFLCVLVGIAAAGLVGRLYSLQITNNERYTVRATEQHRGQFTLPARRGALLDRNGRSLAVSLETRSLYAHPRRLDDARAAAKALTRLMPDHQDDLAERLLQDRPFVYLKRHMSPEDARKIEQQAKKSDALPIGAGKPLNFEKDTRRSYPHKSVAAHVVGFADIDGVGRAGAESRFDERLQGDPSTYLVLKDGNQRLRRELVAAPERPSADVRLTLDLSLQHLAERELDAAMRETGAHAATAIILDPATGQLLALANRPTINPSNPSKRARADARANRAIEHQFEPGSTFKIVPMALAIEQGKVQLGERIYCNDGKLITSDGRRINDVGRNGMLTPRSIMAKSSNIGMVKIARRLDPNSFREGILKFGFGQRSGIDLPAEISGNVGEVKDWSGYTQDTLAFGQEIDVTALQVASAMATIANDGLRIEPRVGLGYELDNHFEPFEPGAQIQVVSAETAQIVASMLEDVVEKGSGTAARIPGYRVAGKSGTAEKSNGVKGYSKTARVASFVGFAPVSDPELVVFVSIDTPQGARRQGGEIAAPVFAKILSEALQYRRVPRDAEPPLMTGVDAPAVPATTRPSKIPVAPGTMPDLRDSTLREAIAALNSNRLFARVEGSGIVYSQTPAPGSPVEPGTVCTLHAASSDQIARRRLRRGGAG
jgi:cell division protein FtsI (penicillin-binding protein 3)